MVMWYGPKDRIIPEGNVLRIRGKIRVSSLVELPRQWPEVSDFVARFCTLRESNNTRFRVRSSHGRALFDSRNVQKSVTQIIYLWPLPRAPSSSPGVFHLVVGRSSGQGWSMLHKPCQLLARESKKSHTCYIFARVQRSNLSTFPFQNVKRRDKREAASALCKSSTV